MKPAEPVSIKLSVRRHHRRLAEYSAQNPTSSGPNVPTAVNLRATHKNMCALWWVEVLQKKNIIKKCLKIF